MFRRNPGKVRRPVTLERNFANHGLCVAHVGESHRATPILTPENCVGVKAGAVRSNLGAEGVAELRVPEPIAMGAPEDVARAAEAVGADVPLALIEQTAADA